MVVFTNSRIKIQLAGLVMLATTHATVTAPVALAATPFEKPKTNAPKGPQPFRKYGSVKRTGRK